MWQKASEEEKAAYIAMSNQDKQRYQAELEAYNYRYPWASSHPPALVDLPCFLLRFALCVDGRGVFERCAMRGVGAWH